MQLARQQQAVCKRGPSEGQAVRVEDAKEAKVKGSEPAEGKQRQKGHGMPGKGKSCREPAEGKQRQREPGEGGE